MTAGALLPPVVIKEIRALWPVWGACALTLLAGAATANQKVLAAGILAYTVGSVALGAHAVGHEYAHRTLGVLLSLPSDRRRLLSIKLGVLAVMLAGLAGLAYGVFFSPHARLTTSAAPTLILLLPVLCGLFVAPWLTMLTRSALAGVVFTISIPGTIWVLGEALGAWLYGASSEVDTFKLAVWLRAVLALCAIGAVLGWRAFMRLQAIEGSGAAIQLPRWFSAAGAARRSHPVWQLVKKEFHLQQLTWVLVGLYVVVWAALTAAKQVIPEFRGFPVIPFTMLFLVLLSMLVGSLASAEERQAGTLEWQLLLPMAAWQQWLVKTGTVLGLAFAFAIGLPAFLTYFDSSGVELRTALRPWREATGMVVLLATCSLYVSSFSASGLRALVLGLPFVAGAALLIQAAGSAAEWVFYHSAVDAAGRAVARHWRSNAPSEIMTPVLAAGFLTLLLRFAFLNHRSAERSVGRVLQQVGCLAAFLVAAVALWVAVLVRG